MLLKTLTPLTLQMAMTDFTNTKSIFDQPIQEITETAAFINETLGALNRQRNLMDMPSLAVTCISALDGYITAVLSAPDMIMPSHWIAGIFGEHQHKWASFEEANAFNHAAMDYHNHLIDILRKEPWCPLFVQIEGVEDSENRSHERVTADPSQWCMGYVHGYHLWPKLNHADQTFVEERVQDFTLLSMLIHPELLEGSYIKEASAFVKKAKSMSPEFRLDMTDAVIAHAKKIYNRFRNPFQERRKNVYLREDFAPNIGREEHCFCGSGKKYRYCHLH